MVKKIHSTTLSFDPPNYIQRFTGVIWWSLVRHKYLLPTFSLVEIILSIAIVYGLGLFLPSIGPQEAVYLSSGTITIGIIAVGCVLAAQIISTAKQDGIVNYQKTLPVSRGEIIIADTIIWGVAALPGIVMGGIAAVIRFKIHLYISPTSILVIIISLATMILIGFSLAYWLPTNIMSLITQVIMIGGLLFSPITYPASRIPDLLYALYQFLPFVPTSDLIRATLFKSSQFSWADMFVVLSWGLIGYGLSLSALSRKE
ncbi:ABC transporter [Lentilactobacillus fungorum]|uniref:ABC transporter n=1 Tax=Lentilactobacillus fungorum TaxID=2201250 RepID=A0ABQ3VXG9_9LACO|nr:ABC transporter permease [Lentilactobacillus fungorum]GHP13612.1 ABC transporter [Lentilactobacillus fungorum]